MTYDQKPTRYEYLRAVGCVALGAMAPSVPVFIAGIMIGFGLDRNLAVILCCGLFAIFCQHRMALLSNSNTPENHKRVLAYFLGFAIAFVFSSSYTVRNMCEMMIPESPNMISAMTLGFAVFAGFYVTATFQGLLNGKNTK